MPVSADKNKPARVKIPFRQKIILIVFALFLLFVLLEAGLRLGGFIFLSLQEHRNRDSLSKKGAYRILCLGESTTAMQYPFFLEEILNQRNAGLKFSVIDKGCPGMETSYILAELESNLDEYHPEMVVTMMGINDIGLYPSYELIPNSTIIRSMRTYKLIRLLWLSILAKLEQYRTELNNRKTIIPRPQSAKAYINLGIFYQGKGKLSQAESAFQKAISTDPKNNWAWLRLGMFYRGRGKFSQAEAAFKKAIKLDPQSESAFLALSALYKRTGRIGLAKEYAEKADILVFKKYTSSFSNSGYYNYRTVNNYNRLKEILDKRGLKLVCVQYPMRSIESLKKVFWGSQEDIIFVDNEMIFKDAVKKAGYKEYFQEAFAGDFGHCTDKGNRLLAENIANTILREVFNK